MKHAKVVKNKTAIIAIVILIIICMVAFFICIGKYYQKEYENFPTISVYYGDKVIGEMLPVQYEWTYKGEKKERKLSEFVGDLMTYNFPEENTVFVDTANFADQEDNYYIKSNIRYKTKNSGFFTEGLGMRSPAHSSSGSDIDESKYLKAGQNFNSFNSIGEYLYSKNINYVKQGSVQYALKVVVFEEDQARIGKDYINTSISDVEKIKELLGKINFNTMLNACKVENKNLILNYDYHIQSDACKMNNLILFACIPELESITYSPNQKKTMVEQKEKRILEEGELEKIVFTREEENNDGSLNVENLKKFMEQI